MTSDDSFPRAAQIAALKARLAGHRLAGVLRTRADLCVFMEHHVVCVWDFMSLLKSLQRDLTCLDVPWTPPVDAEAARLVNEIVLGEESDRAPTPAGPWNGPRFTSHFGWYLEAMREVGADTGPVERLLSLLRAGSPPPAALEICGLPEAAVRFGQQTFDCLDQPLAVRAAVFFHGREDLIPDLLSPLAQRLKRDEGRGGLLLDYIQRHVEVDGGEHGPMSRQLVDRLFARDRDAVAPAAVASLAALQARHALWDQIAARCDAGVSRASAGAGA